LAHRQGIFELAVRAGSRWSSKEFKYG
jgi:hypothetical protein